MGGQLPPEVYSLIDAALSEDQTFNDPTTGVLIPPDIRAVGALRAKAVGVMAGVDVAEAVFRRVDAALEMETLLPDGSPVSPGDEIARVAGSAAGILRAERVALNFMQRMSGIATDTNRYVQAIRGCPARIVDTRKTVPGHRYLDKYAVRMGGGYNHRFNLADGILIKDNHIEALRAKEMDLGSVIKTAIAGASHTHPRRGRGGDPGATARGAGRRGRTLSCWTICRWTPCSRRWASWTGARWSRRRAVSRWTRFAAWPKPE